MKKREIEKLVSDWITILGLGHWDISISYNQPKKLVAQGDYEEHGSCSSNENYLTATINFPPSKLKGVDESVVIHELLHVVTAGLTGYVVANMGKDKWLDYFNEQMTSHLTKAFINYKIWLK